MKNRCIALLFVLPMLAGALPAATYYVDDNAPNDPAPFFSGGSDAFEDGSPEHPFDSIQEAINVAVDGDTIVVAPGRYLSPDRWQYDQLKFNGKNIRLVSSTPTNLDMADQTVLCGVVIFDGTETGDCLLQGFKIQNYGHGGILGNGTQARVSHCIISGNGPCGATVVMDVQGRISNCLIVDNTTFSDCGVLPVVSGCTEFVNCTIANNLSGPALAVDAPIVHNCIIYANQGPPSVPPMSRSAPRAPIDYSLIENWSGGTSYGNVDVDPCFVRLGRWEDVPTPPVRAVRGITVAADVVSLNKVLIEGDYHLKTEGWRWSPEPIHGSHWYYDTVTSPAIDAGDPMDSLGKELERAPDDLEGLWGVNRAINLGAYGGTTRASLAPTRGEAPGVGAVDLRDYWPLALRNRWILHNPDGEIPRSFQVQYQTNVDGAPVYDIRITDVSYVVTIVHGVYANRTLYLTQNTAALFKLPDPPEPIQAQYPQFPIPGSIIEAPFDPFVQGTAEYRSVLVMRGTLAEVLADTSVDPAQFLAGEWPDVIALYEIGDDGTAGEPIAIFARGFGPLMLAGEPIEGATIGSRTFGTGGATRATR